MGSDGTFLYKGFDLRNNDFGLLAPFVRERAQNAIQNAQNAGYDVGMFEGYRSPIRQEKLYAQGRTTPGQIITNAKAWRSFHQYGLALDIAFLNGMKWHWNGAFDKAAQFFIAQGFEWLYPQESVHFQITGGFTIDQANQVTREMGVQTLWEMIKSKL